MEASGALGAGEAEGATEAPEPGLDLSPLMERFELAMGSRMEALESTLLERLGGGEEPEGEDGDEFDLDSLFGEPEDGETQRGLDPQALQQLIDQRTQAALDAHLPGLEQKIQTIQVGLDAEQLTAKYPDLADPAVAGPVVEAAKALAESVGQPELAQKMQFVETVYKAQMADKYAAGERPVGAEQGFELEHAGGAGPGAAPEPNIAERIASRRSEREFWRV